MRERNKRCELGGGCGEGLERVEEGETVIRINYMKNLFLNKNEVRNLKKE